MDRLTSMQVFVRVAELGSFAAAAQEFRLSPAMVAKHIRHLETRLGARVLNRTTRQQSLTEVGRIYLDRCRTVLADFTAAEAAALELQATPRGTLRVTAPVALGACGLAPLLAGFMAQYPEVQVELSLNDRVIDLVEEGYDLALRSGPLPDSGLVARPLRPLRMLLAAAPAYLERRGTPQTVADLSAHDCLAFAHWARKDRWRLLGPAGEETAQVRCKLVINNGEALRQAALAGAGILMQSEMLLAGDLQSGRLLRVLPDHQPPPRPAHLLYLPDRRPTPKLQRFVDYVLSHLGSERTS